MSELRSTTCHMRSHGVTCYPTQVNATLPTPPAARQAGTRYTCPGGIEDWVDLRVVGVYSAFEFTRRLRVKLRHSVCFRTEKYFRLK